MYSFCIGIGLYNNTDIRRPYKLMMLLHIAGVQQGNERDCERLLRKSMRYLSFCSPTVFVEYRKCEIQYRG